MIETMWIWGTIGLILLAVEMVTTTFYVMWFGIAALILAVLTWLMPDMNIAIQLFLFSILSIGSLFIWRTYYKKTSTDSRVGQAQGEEIGRVGVIIEAVSSTQNGRIQFTQGLMGSREWVAVCNKTLEPGTQAVVVAVEGNSLRVKAH
ncbi:NfeD family protein [Methylotenera sp.]|uniref:NfeD family protein n=1 Tax=Methylotenera sp. TaxID=2051956 RepID=UPI0027286C25|nr:NfeD family protein [Methylotenera sp.]MDO9204783.1 NfeD family protein [Methylotenera sp.]